jgi:hypothetical protein
VFLGCDPLLIAGTAVIARHRRNRKGKGSSVLEKEGEETLRVIEVLHSGQKRPVVQDDKLMRADYHPVKPDPGFPPQGEQRASRGTPGLSGAPDHCRARS